MSDAPSTTAKPQRLTSVVRRGFAMILDHNIERHSERLIARATDPLTTTRADRWTAKEVEQLRAAVRWIKQEAASAEAVEIAEVEDGEVPE